MPLRLRLSVCPNDCRTATSVRVTHFGLSEVAPPRTVLMSGAGVDGELLAMRLCALHRTFDA